MSGWEEIYDEHIKKKDIEELQKEILTLAAHNAHPRFLVAMSILAALFGNSNAGKTMEAQKIKEAIHAADAFLEELHKDD